MTREELLGSKGYWTAKIQIDLYHQLEAYMKDNNLNRTQLAERLGVTKGYISQVLNGDFDHKVSKLVDLALAMGKVPEINYPDLQECIKLENRASNDSSSVFKAIIWGNQPQSLAYSESRTYINSHSIERLVK